MRQSSEVFGGEYGALKALGLPGEAAWILQEIPFIGVFVLLGILCARLFLPSIL